MSKRVNALPNKMEPFGLSLIIKKLEFEDPLKKKFVGEFELLPRDTALVDNADRNNQFAIVLIVRLWNYPVEEAGSQAVEIVEKFPSLVIA